MALAGEIRSVCELMTALVPRLLTVDEFLVWADTRHDEPKWELFDGVPQMQGKQQWQHAKIKTESYLALRRSIERWGLPFYAAPDGMTVKVDDRTAYTPDALVAPLPEPAPREIVTLDPIIVVEVLSPSSVRIDLATKVAGYFRVPSIVHYLIIDPEASTVLHHQRSAGGLMPPRELNEGLLRLDPPGIGVTVADLFGAA
jgi:Uma2 family endonuclease